MIPDRNLVRYACIAYRPTTSDAGGASTILAQFNSADASIQSLAQECLLRTPANHSIFNHNIRGSSYTFSIEDPFVFFVISDEKLPKPDKIWLLSRMKDALHDLIRNSNNGKKNHHRHHRRHYGFSSYCFQGELNPVFHQLFMPEGRGGGGDEVEDPNQGGVRKNSLMLNGEVGSHDRGPGSVESRGLGGRGGRRTLGIPLFSKMEEALKKKKKKLLGEESVGESKEMLVDDNAELSDDTEVTSREVGLCHQMRNLVGDGGGGSGGGGLCMGNCSEGKEQARIWRKHVWVVLILDLAVCLILFGIWLMICHGFQCLDG